MCGSALAALVALESGVPAQLTNWLRLVRGMVGMCLESTACEIASEDIAPSLELFERCRSLSWVGWQAALSGRGSIPSLSENRVKRA
jgi:hypothetical protein